MVLRGSRAGEWAPRICTDETRATLLRKVRGLSYTGGNGLDAKGKGGMHQLSGGDLRNVGSHSGEM